MPTLSFLQITEHLLPLSTQTKLIATNMENDIWSTSKLPQIYKPSKYKGAGPEQRRRKYQLCDKTIVLFVSWSNEQERAWILIAHFHVNVNSHFLAAFCQHINIFSPNKSNDLFCILSQRWHQIWCISAPWIGSGLQNQGHWIRKDPKVFSQTGNCSHAGS